MMKRLRAMIHRNPTRRRGARLKRGSVLILVVALLVLMALIGTAWISTARVDRASTIQHVHSTHIDLLIDGEVQKVLAALIRDIKPGEFRSAGGTYRAWDDLKTDRFLAARVPQLVGEVALPWSAFQVPTPTQVGVVPQPARYVRGTVAHNGSSFFVCKRTHLASEGPITNTTLWEPAPAGPPPFGWGDPGDPASQAVVWSAVSHLTDDALFEDLLGNRPEFGERLVMRPFSDDVPAGSGNVMPLLQFYHPGANGGTGGFVFVIAADADGDGIADSPLSRIKVGRLNGLDYFVSVRIVDEGSAVNVNNAWMPEGSIGQNWTSGNLNLGLTSAPVDLPLPLIAGTDPSRQSEMDRLSWPRMVKGSSPMTPPPPPYNGGALNAPLSDNTRSTLNQRQRVDFQYRSIMEAVHLALGRRPGNPGYWEMANGNIAQMSPYAPSETAVLRYKGGTLLNPDGIVADPATPNSYFPSSTIELALQLTLFQSRANHPNSARAGMEKVYFYPGGRFALSDWFRDNYDYEQRYIPPPETDNIPQTWRNRRPLLTTVNGVSNATPRRSIVKFWANNPPGSNDPILREQGYYRFGDVVRYDAEDANGDIVANMPFVCLDPYRANASRDTHRPGSPNAYGLAQGYVPRRGAGGLRSTDQGRIGPTWAPQPFKDYQTRASINSADFADLWLAFWGAMGEEVETVPNILAQKEAPFGKAFEFYYTQTVSGNLPFPATYYNNPYIGNRFQPGYLTTPTYPVVAFDRIVEPNTAQVEQHPARMFRNPLRGVSGDINFPGVWHMSTQGVMQMRAAIAAVNAMDLRDGDDDVTFRDIHVQGYPMPVPVPLDPSTWPYLEARVYGNEPQPFITEVYANTDTENDYPVAQGSATNGRNPVGYVAVELHNPYPYAIDIRYCKIATIDRWPATGMADAPPPLTRHRYSPAEPAFTVFDHHSLRAVGTNQTRTDTDPGNTAPGAGTIQDEEIDLSLAASNLAPDAGGLPLHDPTVIPPNGYLVLENVRANPTAPARPNDALARPPGAAWSLRTGAAGNGQVTATPNANYAYVANLDLVLNKELVLVRPLQGRRVFGNNTIRVNGMFPTANGPVNTAPLPVLQYYYATGANEAAWNMVPLDSFDFTGLPRPILGTTAPRAYAWHYARSSSSLANKAWKFVYPGRYDGTQTLVTPVAPATSRLPRHQGTQEVTMVAPSSTPPQPNDPPPMAPGWNHMGGAERDPWGSLATNTNFIWAPTPNVTLGTGGTGMDLNATYPREFTIQLASFGMPGPNPVLGNTGNMSPFGQFARNLDILQVPYIGAYRIRLPDLPAAQDPNVVEFNAITMDSVFAEDSDPVNDPAAINAPYVAPGGGGDDPDEEDPEPGHPNYTGGYTAGELGIARQLFREQIGRFVPSPADLGIGTEPITAPPGMPPVGTHKPNFASGKASAPGRTIVISGTPFGTLVDARDSGNRKDNVDGREETLADYWRGYELEITDGRGKGQVRLVTASAPGLLTVYPPWEGVISKDPTILPNNAMIPDETSQYVLRRGNYRWTTRLLDYLCVESPQDDHLPNAYAGSYGVVSHAIMDAIPDPPIAIDPASETGMFVPLNPPQAVNNTSAEVPPAVTYGRCAADGDSDSWTGSPNLSDRNGFYGGMVVMFLDGPAAGSFGVIGGYNGATKEFTLNSGVDLFGSPQAGDLFKIINLNYDDTTPSHGLVNINTAPWPVLASIPMLPNAADNLFLARQIVRYRDGDPTAGIVGQGPFRSIHDLMKVPAFMTASMAYMLPPTAVAPPNGGPNAADGDFSPLLDRNGDGDFVDLDETDQVRFDFEEQYFFLNRISNLITTRSDTFTCYVLVQGWRGAGTSNPELVVQRRRAFITDRSDVTPTSGEMPLNYFYNE